MHTFTVLYYRVDDETTLEEFFSAVHLPLLEALPGLRTVAIGRVMGQPLGQSRFTLTVEATFDDRAALEAALATETGIMLMNALRPWAENRLIAWYYADAFREERSL
jgi:uncharacterized protein (TIGR02118 family)